ncbi:MAG: hypothetical protein ACFFB3_07545, partial [Candidatus Hodarchaeota archaeon]
MKSKITSSTLLLALFLLISPSLPTVSANSTQISLTEIGTLYTGSRTVDFCINGEVLYALDLDLGLRIYNISDVTAPTRLS